MNFGLQNLRSVLNDKKGFTLVEMAIVLIIIGVIIGAVVKGKDLVRSAEQKKVYTKFANAWRLAYLNFYDRTGKVLGDFYNTTGAAAGQDGHADTTPNNGAVTEGELVDSTNEGDYLGLLEVGLEAPVTNTADSWVYRYIDSAGIAHDLTISFLFDTYNYMQIAAIPNELAMALDTMIDGEANGTAGDFIGNATAGAAWGTTPTTDTTARWKMQF